MSIPALIAHGGSGPTPDEEKGPRMAAAGRGADAGWIVLQAGGSTVEAVEAAIRQMEDDPLLNAGTGSNLQADGVCRMDASLMAGDGRAGAVAQVPGIRNPIRFARYLLEQEAHVMLCGPEAMHPALKLGQDAAIPATPDRIACWQSHLDESCRRLDHASMADTWKQRAPKPGTVGCVALDREGRLAAGTCTGGKAQC
jgi:beta-aspartyl-peptidase (threonine type)